MIINELLKKRTELKELNKNIDIQLAEIENQIKIFMKERLWDNYNDPESGITVRISTEQRSSWDDAQLQLFLSKEEYEKAKIFKTFEKMVIMTARDKERMNSFVNGSLKKKGKK